MNKRPEILAPAGNMECFRAAVNAGADAIYTGGTKFGARAYAGNFDTNELKEAIQFAHLHDVKVYLTVNTLLKNDELYKEFYDYFAPIYEEGIDAVIIQDIGLMSFVKKYFPDVAIHASTQGALFTHYSANMLKEMFNITRVVPPRELQLEELLQYKKNTDLELEVFVHGALCYCYSGRCLMSSDAGGRSGNRGRCAQPCRYQYQTGSKNNTLKGYFLSPKDICTLNLCHKLCEAGIDSFKIEGRMKKPEYVALCTSLYKEYVLRYEKLGSAEYKRWLDNNEKKIKEDVTCLSDIYNRGGFCDGYLSRHNGKEIMSFARPNHYGTYVGKVTKSQKGSCVIKTVKDVNAHDVLQIRDIREEVIYEFTTGESFLSGDDLTTKVFAKLNIDINQPVYRIRNSSLIDSTLKKYSEEKKEPVNITFAAHKDEPLSLIMNNGNVSVTVNTGMACEATGSPVTADRVSKQLMKLGNTPYLCENIDIQMDDNLFFPMSVINDLRRQSVTKLIEKTYYKYKREIKNDNVYVEQDSFIQNNKKNSDYKLHVICDDYKTVKSLCNVSAISYICFNLKNDENYNSSMINTIEKSSKIPVIILPTVIRYNYFDKVYRLIEQYSKTSSCILSDNTEGIIIAGKAGYLKERIISGAGLYTFNNSSCNIMNNLCDINVNAYELSKTQLKSLNNSNNASIIFGKVPLMISAGCINKNLKKCDKKQKVIKLKSENNNSIEVYNNCDWCYNVITRNQNFSLIDSLGELCKLGIGHFIIDLTHQDESVLCSVRDYCENITLNSDFLNIFEKKICNNTYDGYFRAGVE